VVIDNVLVYRDNCVFFISISIRFALLITSYDFFTSEKHDDTLRYIMYIRHIILTFVFLSVNRSVQLLHILFVNCLHKFKIILSWMT